MFTNKAWGPTEELELIPEDAIVVKGKLLMSLKHWELHEALHEWKARFVGMGNILFRKRMRVIRGSGESLWAPVASLMGARFVQSRSLAPEREAATIDLLSAYLQIQLGGKVPYYIILPSEVMDILPEELRSRCRGIRMPVCRLWQALYGLKRAGFDFITAFILWLRWNKWLQMEKEPAVLYLWRTESDNAAIARATQLREWVLQERAAGRNPFEALAEAQQEPR